MDGKVKNKFADELASKSWSLYQMSKGLTNCGFSAYNNQDYANAAKYFELAAKAADLEMIKHFVIKNTSMSVELEPYSADTARYQNLLYAGSCYNFVDKKKALSIFEGLVGKDTPQLPVYTSIISICNQLSDTVSMIKWFQEGMVKMPTENYFSNNLLALFLDRNDLDSAIDMMKRNVSNNPSNVSIITTIARLYMQKEEYAPAKEYFQKALELDPSNIDANLYYGYTFLAEMEAGESEMLRKHAKIAEMDRFSAGKIQAALPLLRKAFQADTEHENNDIPNLLMQVLYRQFAPTNAPNRKALIDEYNEVARAYGRPEKN